MKKKYTIYLTPSVLEEAKALAKRRKVTLSTVVTDGLVMLINEDKDGENIEMQRWKFYGEGKKRYFQMRMDQILIDEIEKLSQKYNVPKNSVIETAVIRFLKFWKEWKLEGKWKERQS